MQLCVSNCVEIENGVMAYCVIRRRENGLKNFKIRIISDEDEIRNGRQNSQGLVRHSRMQHPRYLNGIWPKL
jgi:hypothetical protein